MKTGVVAVSLLLTSFVTAHAQWQTDGTPVCVATANQTQVAAIPDGTGGAFIAWADNRSGLGDIYLQRVTSGGQALWATDGIAICNNASEQSFPSLVEDGAGGVFIAWHDWRNPTSNQDLYIQRVSSAGAIAFAANGIVLTNAADGQHYPIMVSDGAGGLFAAWLDYRAGPMNGNVYGARMTSNGTLPDGPNGIAISTAVSHQTLSSVIPFGNGGALAAWTDQRNGVPDVYAARVSSTGVLLDATGIPICVTGGEQSYPALVPDGAGGAIVTFCDAGRMGEIYAQRINSAGAAQWTANGVVVGKASLLTNILQQPQTVSDGAGGAILTWLRFDGSDPNIYAQRIDGSGVSQWTADGVPVCNAAGSQSGIVITRDTQGGAVVGWSDPRALTNGGDIYAQRISSTGTALWTANGTVMCDEPFDQSGIAIVSDLLGGAILAWSDRRSFNNHDIYASRVDEDGGVVTDIGDPPHSMSLGANYPNPFNPETTIPFSLSLKGRVTLRIYDASGHFVVTLLDENRGAGEHVARWDGRDARGAVAPTGVYFLRLEASGTTATRKLVLLK